MIVQISKRFSKDIASINDSRVLAKIRLVLEQAQTVSVLTEMPELEAMAGYPGFYRIKFDYRYRIGVYVENNVIVMVK
jgi:hypothetical protein